MLLTVKSSHNVHCIFCFGIIFLLLQLLLFEKKIIPTTKHKWASLLGRFYGQNTESWRGGSGVTGPLGVTRVTPSGTRLQGWVRYPPLETHFQWEVTP